MEKKIEDWLNQLLTHLGISPKKVVVTKDETGTYQAQLDVEEADAGAMIGYQGDTIAALQLLLGQITPKLKESEEEGGNWERVVVNINDYRQKRQEALEQTAQDTAEKVKTSGQPIALFNLNPYERRLVHMILSKDPEVITESEGEGNNRHLIVSPRPQDDPPLADTSNE